MAANKKWLFLRYTIQWFLGLIFIYASFHKILDPSTFAKVIYGYDVFPASTINIIAIVIPFLELFCGIALILNIHSRSAVLLVNLMLLGFIIAIGYNILRGHEFDCGCFTFGKVYGRSAAISLLFRDIGMLLCGILLWFGPSRFERSIH